MSRLAAPYGHAGRNPQPVFGDDELLVFRGTADTSNHAAFAGAMFKPLAATLPKAEPVAPET
jgi:hypothetical protein